MDFKDIFMAGWWGVGGRGGKGPVSGTGAESAASSLGPNCLCRMTLDQAVTVLYLGKKSLKLPPKWPTDAVWSLNVHDCASLLVANNVL